jgi:formylglycine-generating enzyme required for sulfatase activity
VRLALLACLVVTLFSPSPARRYLQFLQDSGWWPGPKQPQQQQQQQQPSLADGQSAQNFLNHWAAANTTASASTVATITTATATPRVPVAGTEQQPVRWVSLNDARRYCAFYGQRLPRDFEWQFAAQGGDASRLYPWGSQWDSDRVPPVSTARTMGEPVDVGAFPLGASTFGVEELVGHLWQWTDEYCDAHTCRAIVRGGHWWRCVRANARRQAGRQAFVLSHAHCWASGCVLLL